MSNDLFALEWDESTGDKETFKWTLGNNRHELNLPLLRRMDTASVVDHCLQVMHRINMHVGTNVNHRFVSYTQVVPMTLSIGLRATWDLNAVDNPMPTQDVAGFHALVKSFIAVHASEEDRHELLQFMQQAEKPRNMDVLSFFVWLRMLNSYIEWLPGNDAALTDIQLNQAFHDDMPTAWQDCYRNAGRTVRHDTHAEITRFFRKQQSAVSKAARDNTKAQCAERSTAPRARQSNRSAAERVHRKSSNKDSKHHSDKKSTPKGTSNGRIADNTKCPIHPHGTHTWGECMLNASNPNRKAKSNGDKKPAAKSNGNGKKSSKDDADANIMNVDDDDSSMSTASVSDSISSAGTSPRCLRAMNDDEFDDDDDLDENVALGEPVEASPWRLRSPKRFKSRRSR